jgi:hypothetical protein
VGHWTSGSSFLSSRLCSSPLLSHCSSMHLDLLVLLPKCAD